MDNQKIVNQVISDLEKKNWEHVENKLTDDFTFSGTVPKPINKKEWVDVHRAILSGIPDLKFNLQQIVEKGVNKVTAKVKLTGMNTGYMPSLLPGTTPIEATGKKVTLPEEEMEFTFRGDKISGVYMKPVPYGGVKGILEQLKPEKMAHV